MVFEVQAASVEQLSVKQPLSAWASARPAGLAVWQAIWQAVSPAAHAALQARSVSHSVPVSQALSSAQQLPETQASQVSSVLQTAAPQSMLPPVPVEVGLELAVVVEETAGFPPVPPPPALLLPVVVDVPHAA